MAALPETHVDVTAQSTYPTNPQISFPFIPDWLLFTNTANTAIVHISFDGKTDNAYINPVLSPFMVWPGNAKNIVDRIWIRRDAPGVSTAIVIVTGATNS